MKNSFNGLVAQTIDADNEYSYSVGTAANALESAVYDLNRLINQATATRDALIAANTLEDREAAGRQLAVALSAGANQGASGTLVAISDAVRMNLAIANATIRSAFNPISRSQS